MTGSYLVNRHVHSQPPTRHKILENTNALPRLQATVTAPEIGGFFTLKATDLVAFARPQRQPHL